MWMNPENTRLSERSQTQKDKHLSIEMKRPGQANPCRQKVDQWLRGGRNGKRLEIGIGFAFGVMMMFCN